MPHFEYTRKWKFEVNLFYDIKMPLHKIMLNFKLKNSRFISKLRAKLGGKWQKYPSTVYLGDNWAYPEVDIIEKTRVCLKNILIIIFKKESASKLTYYPQNINIIGTKLFFFTFFPVLGWILSKPGSRIVWNFLCNFIWLLFIDMQTFRMEK